MNFFLTILYIFEFKLKSKPSLRISNYLGLFQVFSSFFLLINPSLLRQVRLFLILVTVERSFFSFHESSQSWIYCTIVLYNMEMQHHSMFIRIECRIFVNVSRMTKNFDRQKFDIILYFLRQQRNPNIYENVFHMKKDYFLFKID